LPLKKQVSNAYEKSIQKAIERISLAIGSLDSNQEKEGRLSRFFNRFR